MANALDAVSKKWLMLALLVVVLVVATACGKSGTPPAGEAQRQSGQSYADLERRMAILAVEALVANIDSMLDLGAFQPQAGEHASEKIVAMMNSAQAPEPGDPKLPGPRFTYVADQGSGPWQVVLRIEGESMRVTAYGSSAGQALEQRTIPLGRH